MSDESAGDRAEADRLFALAYEDLRAIAQRQLRREGEGHTLSTTALVHEAWLDLAARGAGAWRDRVHFFALASRAMRHILVDHARGRGAGKRGGGSIRVPLDEEIAAGGDADADADARSVDLLALDEALAELARRDERMGRIVECRFFGGMSVAETAEALDTSVRTVEREWTRAKAHLYRLLVDE